MGKGEGSGGGDWLKMGTAIAGATAGAFVGGPAGAAAGWQLGSMGGDLIGGATGMEKTGSGIAGTTQKVGDIGSTVAGVGSAASGALNASSAADASKGFSGITSAGEGVDVGGTNAWGQALGAGKGNPTIPTENGFGKLGDLITKSMDTAGSILKPQQESTQGNLQPMQMVSPPQMAAPMNLSSVIAAQLINPSSQNRLAYMHPGRM